MLVWLRAIQQKEKLKYNLILVSIDTISGIIIMTTKTQEQILAFLVANPEEQLAIRGIARKLNKSYTLVYNNITDLARQKLISKLSVPPAQIIRLNEFAPTELFVDIELNRKKEFLKKFPWAEVMLEDVFSATGSMFFIMLVFGSYAKCTQTPRSDIDLLVIIQGKKDIAKIENALYNAYTKVKKSMHIVEASDFKEMIKNTNELNVGNEAKKHHIILYGAEMYYQLLKRTYKK